MIIFSSIFQSFIYRNTEKLAFVLPVTYQNQ